MAQTSKSEFPHAHKVLPHLSVRFHQMFQCKCFEFFSNHCLLQIRTFSFYETEINRISSSVKRLVLFLVYLLYGMEKEKIVMQRQIYKFKEKLVNVKTTRRKSVTI